MEEYEIVLWILYQIEPKEQNKKQYICLLVGKKSKIACPMVSIR